MIKEPFIMNNGQLNLKKSFLLAIIFSLSTAFLVKFIESATLVYQYLPFLTVFAITLGIIHFMILFYNELRIIYEYLHHLMDIRPLYNPFVKTFKDIQRLKDKIVIQIKVQNTQENLCVFRC
jgi:hypothetical protein